MASWWTSSPPEQCRVTTRANSCSGSIRTTRTHSFRMAASSASSRSVVAIQPSRFSNGDGATRGGFGRFAAIVLSRRPRSLGGIDLSGSAARTVGSSSDKPSARAYPPNQTAVS